MRQSTNGSELEIRGSGQNSVLCHVVLLFERSGQFLAIGRSESCRGLPLGHVTYRTGLPVTSLKGIVDELKSIIPIPGDNTYRSSPMNPFHIVLIRDRGFDLE